MREGDDRARAALDKPASQLGMALAGAVALLDPQTIVVAGGLADALDMLVAPIVAAMRRRLPAHLRGIDVRPAAFGPHAALVGAALAGAAGAGWRHLQ